MTRGTIYAICDKPLIVESTEFNGHMYPDGHGQEVIKMLENSKTLFEFRNNVEEFNKKEFQYENDIIYLRRKSKYLRKNKIVFTDKNYFEKFFSDWTFWKNYSGVPVTLVTIDKKEIVLNPNEQVAIEFGKYTNHYKTEAEYKEIIEKEKIAQNAK